jgi:hypothetical protein
MDPSEPSRPNEKARPRPYAPGPPSLPAPTGEIAADDAPALAAADERTPAVIRLEAEPLLVTARFRGVLVASRLLVADDDLRRRSRAAAAFHIGCARGVDAPVNPAYFGGGARHTLVELDAPGAATGQPSWIVSLAPAMRAELYHGAQRLALDPDPPARAPDGLHAPLALPARASLRIRCGEMAFEILPAGPHVPLPRPWLAPGWRREGAYLAGAALALAIVLASVLATPSDPKAISLDDIGRTIILDHSWTVPPVVPETPAPGGAPANATSGRGGRPAPGEKGQAGDRHAPRAERRIAVRGPADNLDPVLAAKRAAEAVTKIGILGLLRADPQSALASVLEDRPVLGTDTATVLGNLRGVDIGAAYGVGGLSVIGTGEGGGGTGLGLEGSGTLNTIGDRRGGTGPGKGYGRGVGPLGRRTVAVLPQIIPGKDSVRGALDKEIVRRIVRLHLNEVRYCYEQDLVRHPGLAGRLVVQFAIAGTGQVISSVVQSTTLGSPGVGACVTQAVRRWPFPKPEGGGLVLVSYPFQLQPAGGS